MPNRLGNSSPGKRSVGTGSGVPHHRVPFAHVTLTGAIGEVQRLSINEILSSYQVGQVQFQVTSGTVNIYRSLAAIDIAMSPDQDTGNTWVLEKSALTTGSIYTSPLGTAFRIDFTTAAVVYIAGS